VLVVDEVGAVLRERHKIVMDRLVAITHAPAPPAVQSAAADQLEAICPESPILAGVDHTPLR